MKPFVSRFLVQWFQLPYSRLLQVWYSNIGIVCMEDATVMVKKKIYSYRLTNLFHSLSGMLLVECRTIWSKPERDMLYEVTANNLHYIQWGIVDPRQQSVQSAHTHMPNTGTESTGWSRYTHGVMYTVHQSSTPCDHKVRWLWTAESSNNCRLMSWRIQVATVIQVPVLLWASCHRCCCAAYAAPITGHWRAWIAGLTIFGRLCYHEIVLITVAIEEYVHERSLSVL